MDSSSKKMYCTHEIDAKTLYDTYLSEHAPYSVIKDTTINVLQAFYNAFSKGLVKGNTVIDLSPGPTAYHLLAMCDFVEKITVLKLNDGSLKELEKWKNKEPDAFKWGHAIEILQQLKRNRDELEDEEENLRGKIDKILKWDPSKGSPADVLSLPKADIVINMGIMEAISRDVEDFRRNLRTISTFIQKNGFLIIYAANNASNFSVREDKFHILPCDERLYRKVISEQGFKIEHLVKFDRSMCSDAVDHEGGIFIIASKLEEP